MTETISENHNQPKCRIVEPSPSDTSAKQLSFVRTRVTVEEEEESLKQLECAVKICLLGISETTPRNSHQYGSLNLKNYTKKHTNTDSEKLKHQDVSTLYNEL